MNKLIKIYGERNTNTNYLSQLIRLNLQVKEIPGTVPTYIKWLQNYLPNKELIKDIYFGLTFSKNLGWKHSYIEIDKLNRYNLVRQHNIIFLTITKNPYSWLLSLYRNPYHQYYQHKPDFETFLKTPWKTVSRDKTVKILPNPIELWNIKNSSYIRIKQNNVLNITSESILQNPQKTIENLSHIFSIKKLSPNFTDYEKSTKKKYSHQNSNYYKNYYLNNKWQDELSQTAIARINSVIDKELMSHFGYKLLLPDL